MCSKVSLIYVTLLRFLFDSRLLTKIWLPQPKSYNWVMVGSSSKAWIQIQTKNGSMTTETGFSHVHLSSLTWLDLTLKTCGVSRGACRTSEEIGRCCNEEFFRVLALIKHYRRSHITVMLAEVTQSTKCRGANNYDVNFFFSQFLKKYSLQLKVGQNSMASEGKRMKKG